MSTTKQLHQKKVRNMGTFLAVLSWLALALYAFGFLLLVAFAVFFPKDPDVLGEPILPDGITLESTVGELVQADKQFLLENGLLSGIHGALALVFYAVIAIILLRIALSWRRVEPFSHTTVLGLRWLGALFLAQFFFGFLYYLAVPVSLTDVMIHSQIYDVALDVFTGSYGLALESGILFLTLSWVLEHGQKLKEEQELTI